ncbi:MAG: hypothetical protein EAZ78_03530 [Oscillatoriales cyanobacterium]|uniref:Uncharacterized protein n=1 Tax=Microcoleus anatoxicus PTRS2 TaxID=2705321 RepID=A0ABU8YSE6_9CYAN|nr:MAG: hypothetical protein EA000_09930 [Oscillatoriales cyanobacterium]TAD96704.1 MAG: hypothetical protein EAZ96_25765 [Oscillatoriales cyanobacterium]TAD98625.1 MAG: hypothetical protein EAZ98_06210 [Oscillatoriales cyanobacterium]TAF06154.1 MAG: hypothetical protein EAZ78_03530 [Oscillatoriales cyanobacterium]TAF47954.1 MAG: hypothetical protein EAZ68_00825 [Oscillatoriales cyanobacterium]
MKFNISGVKITGKIPVAFDLCPSTGDRDRRITIQKTVNGECETADRRTDNTEHNRQLNTHRSP